MKYFNGWKIISRIWPMSTQNLILLALMATDCWNLWKNYFSLKWLKWLSCYIAYWIQNLISFISLKEIWHYAIQTGRVNRTKRTVTTSFHALSAVDEKSSFLPAIPFCSQYGNDRVFVALISSYLKLWIQLCQICAFISEFMILKI